MVQTAAGGSRGSVAGEFHRPVRLLLRTRRRGVELGAAPLDGRPQAFGELGTGHVTQVKLEATVEIIGLFVPVPARPASGRMVGCVCRALLEGGGHPGFLPLAQEDKVDRLSLGKLRTSTESCSSLVRIWSLSILRMSWVFTPAASAGLPETT